MRQKPSQSSLVALAQMLLSCAIIRRWHEDRATFFGSLALQLMNPPKRLASLLKERVFPLGCSFGLQP